MLSNFAFARRSAGREAAPGCRLQREEQQRPEPQQHEGRDQHVDRASLAHGAHPPRIVSFVTIFVLRQSVPNISASG
jgi:hypothetical protein